MSLDAGAYHVSVCVDQKFVGLTTIALKCRIFKVHQQLLRAKIALFTIKRNESRVEKYGMDLRGLVMT